MKKQPKKTNKVETTNLQKRTAENVIKQNLEGKNVNYKRAILDAGGAESTSNAPALITKSKGYLAYMDQYGITEERVVGLISEEIAAIPAGNRLNEIKFIAQLRGMLENNINLNVTQSDEALEAIKTLINEQNRSTE